MICLGILIIIAYFSLNLRRGEDPPLLDLVGSITVIIHLRREEGSSKIYFIFTPIKLMDLFIHNAEKPDRGICTAAMQDNKGSDLQQVPRNAVREKREKNIDRLPTENVKKEPPPCRNY